MKTPEQYIDLANEEAAKAEGFESFEESKKAFAKSPTEFNELDRVWNRQCGRALRIAVDTMQEDHDKELIEFAKFIEDNYSMSDGGKFCKTIYPGHRQDPVEDFYTPEKLLTQFRNKPKTT